MTPEQLSALGKVLEVGPRMGITEDLQKKLEACYLNGKLPSREIMEDYQRQLKHLEEVHYKRLDMWEDLAQGAPTDLLERLRAQQLNKKHNPEKDPTTEARSLGMLEKAIKSNSESQKLEKREKSQNEGFNTPFHNQVTTRDSLNEQEPVKPATVEVGFNRAVLLCLFCYGLLLFICGLLFWALALGVFRYR